MKKSLFFSVSCLFYSLIMAFASVAEDTSASDGASGGRFDPVTLVSWGIILVCVVLIVLTTFRPLKSIKRGMSDDSSASGGDTAPCDGDEAASEENVSEEKSADEKDSGEK